MTPSRPSVLLVEPDDDCGRALATLLRRQGQRVHVVRTRSQALSAVRRERFAVAIVDLFVDGGGAELARDLSARVPRLLLSLGARLNTDELLEAALGFPVLRKRAVAHWARRPGERR